MLRVLHVIPSLSPRRGGPSAAVRNVSRALRRRGLEVDVATTDDDGAGQRLTVPLDRFVEVEGTHVRYFPRQTGLYSLSYPLLRWLGQHVRDYDLVHTHGLFSFAPLAAAWQARKARVPYIMRPAGVLDSWGLKNKRALIKRTSIHVVEGPLLRDAAAVHFMTELERRRAAELSLTLRPVVLPIGFDFGPSPNAQPDAAGSPVILYLSRIHEIKRVDLLLRAFAALPERESCRLAIAGDGEPSLVASLKELAAQLGLGACVQWLGFAERARKRELLGGAAVFVLPSASENFGVAILEAMHAGLPVIVTAGAGLAEFVRSAGAGIVTDGSLEGLRSALVRLVCDRKLRRVMGHAGALAVQRELSLDACGNRLESLYRAVLNRARIGAPAADASP
ncbi:MAG TPA: glycosyltransferase [Steroidobacteraceae bacterium]|nr:glycosyltransferase [Steroidobacteraceae bacterium]